MGEPWFQRFAGFSYRPTCWKGWLVLAAMAGVCIPFGLIWLAFADSDPVLSWVSAGVAVVTAIVGHAVVVWKLDRNYRR